MHEESITMSFTASAPHVLHCWPNPNPNHQVNRDLRKTLSQDLRQNIDREAFSTDLLPSDIPRADDVEALVVSYPDRHELQ